MKRFSTEFPTLSTMSEAKYNAYKVIFADELNKRKSNNISKVRR